MATYILGNYKYVLNDNDYTASVYNNTTALSTYEEITNPIVYDGNTYTVVSMARCFSNCTSLTQAPVIPSTVTNVNLCFSNCSSLTQAPAIPTGVTNMSSCFDRCTSLTQAPAIPSSVTNIEYCFNGCTSLTQAPEMPINITSMKSCFQGCTSLTQAPEIPSGVTNMQYCFYGCTSLTGSITVNNNPSSYSNIFNGTTESIKIFCIGGDISSDSTWSNIAGNYSNITTPADVSGEVFYHGDYKYTVNIGSGIHKTASVRVKDKTKTEYGAIETGIRVNDGIGSGNIIDVTSMILAFYGCTSLTTPPEIPSGVTNIQYTFQGCSSLTTPPEIPSSVTSIQYAFDACSSLTTPPEIPIGVTSMSYTFRNCSSLTTPPEIPSGVTSMNYTFYGCSSLTTPPEIPSSVTNIQYTFQGCSSLTTAPEIPSGVTNMSSTFDGCTSLTTPPEIPSSVTSMSSTFRNCSFLTTPPEIPSGVTNIQYTFQGCSSLTTPPEIPSGVTNMYSTFEGCSSLTTPPEIPSSVTSMYSTFRNCTSLTTAPEIPSIVTNMEYTFSGCTSLQGSVSVYNSPIYYETVFRGTTQPIYIINNSSNTTAVAIWRYIASKYSNVHYEADDMTVPQLSMSSLLRTLTAYPDPDAEKADVLGTYLYLSSLFTVYQDGLPSGWSVRIKSTNNKELYIDTVDQTSNSVFTETTEATNITRIKAWYDTNDSDQHRANLNVYYEVLDDVSPATVRATGYVTVNGILSSSIPLVSYKAGGDGIALGMRCPSDGFHVGMDATFYENLYAKQIPGIIKMFAGTFAPTGWLLCNGDEVAVADYPFLYDVIGDTYGTPSDSEHFVLPDFRGRSPLGAGIGTASDATLRTLGQEGGSERVTLNANQSGLRAHTHGFTQPTVNGGSCTITSSGAHTNHTMNGYGATLGTGSTGWRFGSSGTKTATGIIEGGAHTHTVPGHTHTVTNGAVGAVTGGAVGASESHGNMSPYLTVNYIISTGGVSKWADSAGLPIVRDVTVNGQSVVTNEIAEVAKTITLNPTFTTTTGAMVLADARQSGKVVWLSVSVNNSSSVSSGGNIYLGTVSGIPLPPRITTGGGYYGAWSIQGALGASGTLTVRNASASSATISGTNNTTTSFCYVTN